jgi:hypothetical protein
LEAKAPNRSFQSTDVRHRVLLSLEGLRKSLKKKQPTFESYSNLVIVLFTLNLQQQLERKKINFLKAFCYINNKMQIKTKYKFILEKIH